MWVNKRAKSLARLQVAVSSSIFALQGERERKVCSREAMMINTRVCCAVDMHSARTLLCKENRFSVASNKRACLTNDNDDLKLFHKTSCLNENDVIWTKWQCFIAVHVEISIYFHAACFIIHSVLLLLMLNVLCFKMQFSINADSRGLSQSVPMLFRSVLLENFSMSKEQQKKEQ